jgi:transcription termination factor Rho
MELVLDRRLADRRLWPAIDIQLSGTRKEERLLGAQSLARITLLRRSLSELKPPEAMESLTKQLAKFPTNAAFLDRIGQFQKGP